ncbi:MAG TPA: hypothetical protein V6D30_00120 [Leptolyngbyaceae cyanobacterium]
MSPRKLSDADKSDILNLYRHPEETTSTLASRYEVSNSTISRILKSSLLESEYEALIQQKRANRTPSSMSSLISQASELPGESDADSVLLIQTPKLPLEPDAESTPLIQTPEPPLESDSESSVSTSIDQRRRRKRSSVTLPPATEQKAIQTELQLDITDSSQESNFDEPNESLDEIEPVQLSGLEELLDEDLMDLNDEDSDLDDEDADLDDEDSDLDDDLEDDWEDDAADAGTQGPVKTSRAKSNSNVQVLPLSEASLPRTCYLVVDRAAELIARPLKEFSDLGRIPIEEVQERTLPVFDNHRVARRFSNRSQRVIKVPDGRMLQKTCSHLQAKGITRLLIDGQVYSLLPAQPPS